LGIVEGALVLFRFSIPDSEFPNSILAVFPTAERS